MQDANVPELLDLIYGAAIEPTFWPRALRRLSDMTGSHGVVLTRQNEESGKGEGIRAEANPDATRLYYGHFATRNVFLKADNARAALKSYRPGVLTDRHKVPREALLRSEYYNDFMRLFDVHSVLMLRLSVVGMDTVVLNLHRTKRSGEFGDPEIKLANTLLPHLIRAVDMGQKVAAAQLATDGLATAQDRSPHGLFVVDDAAGVRHANAAGQALLTGSGALRLTAGRLTAAAPDVARRLDGLIRTATCEDSATRASGSMALRSPHHPAPLVVTVVPANRDAAPVLSGSRSAIVCVTDPQARLNLSELTLRDLYGFTPAEMRVAIALFEGLDPAEVAEHLNLSVATVRTHLVHIFDKTEVRSQVDLTRLLMRTLGGALG
jgi:DNA-binding CsgD family transcriptional regulator